MSKSAYWAEVEKSERAARAGAGAEASLDEEESALRPRHQEPVKVPKDVDQELHHAVQAKLIALAAKPVTPRSLLELEQMTRILRQLVAVGLDPAPMAHHPSDAFLGSVSPWPMSIGSGETLAGSGSGTGMPLAPSSPVENFGATVVRELMSLLGAKKPEALSETDQLIDDIAHAREKGLKDVEEMLMKKLFVKLTANQPPSAFPDLVSLKTPFGTPMTGTLG